MIIFFALSSPPTLPLSHIDEYLALYNKISQDASEVQSGDGGVVSFDDAMRKSGQTTKKEIENDKAGVCVQVRVKLDQALTLTRVAFVASLELQNDGTEPLTNITLEMRIYRSGDANKTLQNHLFVIGDPSPVFQGGINGSGVVPAQSSGLTEFLFMPLREAAPTENVAYSVGGTLSYAVDGVVLVIDLFPDTITVVPDARWGQIKEKNVNVVLSCANLCHVFLCSHQLEHRLLLGGTSVWRRPVHHGRRRAEHPVCRRHSHPQQCRLKIKKKILSLSSQSYSNTLNIHRALGRRSTSRLCPASRRSSRTPRSC